VIEKIYNLRTDRILSEELNRDVYIYLPPQYFNDSERRFPVLYMHDAQNLFDMETANYGGWKIDRIAEDLILKGEIEPVIIVGVENTSFRALEYAGFSALYKHSQNGKEDFVKKAASYSSNYRDFIINKLKPLIDEKYRTFSDRENTAIAGSSFGAAVSFYTGYKHDEIFGMIGALSFGNYNPDVSQWNEKPCNVTEYLIDNIVTEKKKVKIYLDCGMLDVDEIFYPKSCRNV
jgi:enterochelin esterase-like enzyme